MLQRVVCNKLRQFGEQLAQQVAARIGVFASTDERQAERLRRLQGGRFMPWDVDMAHEKKGSTLGFAG
jgi:type I restriction enzyme, R subunit